MSDRDLRLARRIKRRSSDFQHLDYHDRQRNALQKWERLGKSDQKSNYRIHAVEKADGSGCRQFCVQSWFDFARFYLDGRKGKRRHFHEVIVEKTPCRLHLDFEYCKTANPDAKSDELLSHFMEIMVAMLRKQYDITLGDWRSKTLLLDSSTAQKWSKHAIVHLDKGRLFSDNAAVGSFVSSVSREWMKSTSQKVMNTDGKEVSLCDVGIYTRNRNFRLFLSSKPQSGVCLRRDPSCSFYGDDEPDDDRVLQDSLVVPLDYWRAPLLKPVSSDADAENDQPPTRLKHSLRRSLGKSSGQGPSRWPYLDDFMLSVVQRWKHGTAIRSWALLKPTDNSNGEPTHIIYYFTNCRYCFNVSREHRNNGVYWTVALGEGTYWQKCFDVECRGFSSNRFPLPKRVHTRIVSSSSRSA